MTVVVAGALGVPATAAADAPAAPPAPPPSAAAADVRVLAISLDGFNPEAITRLGVDGTPNLHRLLRQGAGTLNARTQVEQTVTLPNHTSMVTGRRIDARHEGHGVTWNEHRPGTTVQGAAGHGVASIFSLVQGARRGGAVFATKSKFSLFNRSWDAGVDRMTIDVDDSAGLVPRARRDLRRHHRAFTLLHLGETDQVGHASGFMSPAYLDAVRRVDALLGTLLDDIDSHGSLDDLVIVLTADHGGAGSTSHSDRTRRANYRVPFLVWGPGVTHANLYDLNPQRHDPGRNRPGFTGSQPIRNGEVANLSADLLGLGPVPDSRWNHGQSLKVR